MWIRHSFFRKLFLLTAAQALCWPAAAFAQEKKIIQFGWDMPNTQYLSEHILNMERQPFDGLVFSARFTDTVGGTKLFHNQLFGRRAISWSAVEPAVRYLKATRFYRFTENFLRINVEPGDVDWFEDFSAILHNLGVAGRIVREGKVRGVFFDLEQYGTQLFDFSKLANSNHRSFADYQEKVRLRGAEVMEALQREAPGLTVFLPVSYQQTASQRGELSARRYGLLPAFLDGLIGAARVDTLVVDGVENAYGYQRGEQFEETATAVHRGYPALSTLVGTEQQRRISVAFPVWIDFESNKGQWNTLDPSRNRYSPESFGRVIADAARASDRYVWVYSEQPRWWTGENLPKSYVRALERAREELRMRRPGEGGQSR